MNNVIKIEVDSATADIQRIIDEENQKLQKLADEAKLFETNIRDLDVEISYAKGESKKALTESKKQVTAHLKQRKNEVGVTQDKVNAAENDLAKLRGGLKRMVVKETSENAAEKVFTDNNIHYVINDQQWWSVDAAGTRMDVKINAGDTSVIKDLIFYESDIWIEREAEMKQLAKQMGRMFKHIVRDFVPEKVVRPGVYNQMSTIRKQWLVPIFGVEPAIPFRLLMLSIAGGSEEYADQLERLPAYRYEHPEDVMVPNIDSCGVGGTGRDTYFNILSTIFTNECTTSVAEETFKGTHNGELFGKMIVKVDEKNSQAVPIDKLKELTGSSRYRHREMNKNAREVDRLFSFLMFRNGFTTTVRLAGTGSSGEDRRWDPMIARVNLNRHVAVHCGLIPDINTPTTIEQETAVQMHIKDWQRDYYKNEKRIAEWLGYCIQKYDAKKMTEMLPVHGHYYHEMLERQKKGIDGFMPKFMELLAQGKSNVIGTTAAQKLYEVSESVKVSKDWFRNAMSYWLNSKAGWDTETVMENVYTFDGCRPESRVHMPILRNRLTLIEKNLFDISDFIDPEALDEKGTTVGEKINVFSIRDQLR